MALLSRGTVSEYLCYEWVDRWNKTTYKDKIKKIVSDMVFIYWMLMKLPFLQIIFTSFTTQAQYFLWISLTNLKSEYIFALKIVIQRNVLLLPHTLSVNFELPRARATKRKQKFNGYFAIFWRAFFFKKWLNGNCLKRISNL